MKLSLLFLTILSSLCLQAQVSGCPDPAANNYNSAATVNDGSCSYNSITLKPKTLYNLNAAVYESSGLIWWKSKAFTHEDSGGEAALYAMNTSSNTIQRKIVISNATNVDWEDITQDSKYFYIGDIGNNVNGNRTNLKIYIVKKSAVNLHDTVTATVINFSYEDQTDFTPAGNNNTDFDCEAIIAYNDSLFLFSKNWITNKTRLYKLPKKPGTYKAIKIGELNVQGLVTGADVIPAKRVIVLTGYSSFVQPFVYLLYDFTGNNFFSANKRKIVLNEPFTQTEGVYAKSSTSFLLSNERFSHYGITTPAKLEQLNLSNYLNPYYKTLTSNTATKTNISGSNSSFASLSITDEKVKVERNRSSVKEMFVQIVDAAGHLKLSESTKSNVLNLDISHLPAGSYTAKVFSASQRVQRKFEVE